VTVSWNTALLKKVQRVSTPELTAWPTCFHMFHFLLRDIDATMSSMFPRTTVVFKDGDGDVIWFREEQGVLQKWVNKSCVTGHRRGAALSVSPFTLWTAATYAHPGRHYRVW
jgi:hypothetical protein